MKKLKFHSVVMLLATAFIWGVSFVAQSVGMEHVGPLTFNGVRSLLGGVVLIPCVMLFDKMQGKKISIFGTQSKKSQKTLILGGVFCGLILAISSTTQQYGIMQTSVGKAGFITALYIIIVPILGLFFKKKVPLNVWISVALAVFGMYQLCVTEQFTLGTGDTLVLLCAVGFSVHILVIDHFSPFVDGVRMSCIQFFTAGIVCIIPAFIFENPQFADIMSAWLPIAYAGIMSCGVAYTMQIVAQKNTDPTVASLILSLESVFAALAGWVIIGQELSTKEIIGCGIVFVAIILAQLPDKRKK